MPDVSAGARLAMVLDQLGIRQAHFAFGMLPGDVDDLVVTRPHLVASITAVMPAGVSGSLLTDRRPVSVVVRHGERSVVGVDPDDLARVSFLDLPEGYEAEFWSDIAAEQPALLASMLQQAARQSLPPAAVDAGEQLVEEVRLRIEGSGPPLVLLPAGLWPSQWDAVVPTLAEAFTVIRVSGPHFGMFARLERSNWYPDSVDLMDAVFRRLALRDGEAVLDVGSGPGTYVREFARRLGSASTIAALEPNGHFLDESRALARAEGTEDRIVWRRGSAEALPFEDESFDAVFSIRVLEECDAEAALNEIHRVLRPGGRVCIVVRATDIPRFLNYDLDDDLREVASLPTGPVAERGCADRSLYERVSRRFVAMSPWPGWRVEAPLQPFSLSMHLGHVTGAQREQLLAEVVHGNAAGTGFFAHPLHCVVARKA